MLHQLVTADTDPAWGNSYDIGDAVAEAAQYGYTDNSASINIHNQRAVQAGGSGRRRVS